MNISFVYTMVLVWVTPIPTDALTSQSCPMHCQCSKKKQTMDCDGKDGFHASIPMPPSYVKEIKLTHGNFTTLTKETMKNLTFCSITVMSFKNNNIRNISPDALSELRYLQELEWKQSYLPIAELGRALQSLMSPISRLQIEADTLDTQTVLASTVQHLTSLQIVRLHLKDMKAFNTTGLRHMKTLKTLDLYANQLTDFTLEEVVQNLEILSLKQNNLGSLPSLCSGRDIPLTPKLKSINLQDNAIRYLKTFGLSCLENLSEINLSQNRIEHLRDNAFANLSSLLELDLSVMKSLRKLDALTFNSSSLTKLYLKELPRLSIIKFNPKVLFLNTPNLTSLNMKYTKININANQLKDLFTPLKNIQHLILPKTHIECLPVGLFSHLRNLTLLDLSGTSLSGWDKNVFADVISIEKISFRGSDIKIINEYSFPLEFRQTVKEIDLANNPFTCTCDLFWFRTWMKEVMANKSITFPNFPYQYECRSPNVNPFNLTDYNPYCNINELYLVLLVTVLSVCMLFTVAGLVTYRYRWYILYWISLMRRRRQRQGPPKEKQYDGFVSYSNPDWDWVSSELLDFLEGQVGMRLCEHSRDFKAGVYIVDNVIEAMETSRKTILVISNEYMKSDWCQFELQMALSSFLQKEIDLVVILLEGIQSNHVTSSLRALMVSTTYIEWSEDHIAKRLFKGKTQNAMLE